MDTLQLNELLECSVCLERLEDNCKVLPCQHTFCLRCLKQIVASRKELRCPECRILVTEDVDDLPTNILLVRILEGIKRQKDIKNKAKENAAESSSKENQEDSSSTLTKEPTAKALYDYEPQELGDLVLKKGQVIELIRQVDTNWYEGKINGQQGFLPANYVEILVPLPNFDDRVNRGPVARALYDFEDPEEKDLLSFKQGGIIQVIRRVDENWCEGRIDNIYGIFPVTFVEFNDAARSIIFSQNSELSVQAPWDQTVQVRPTRRSKPVREVKRHTIHGEGRQQMPTQNGNAPNRHSVEVTCSERFEAFCNEALSSSQSVHTNGSLAGELASRTAEETSTPSRSNEQDEDSSSLSQAPSSDHSRQNSRESPPPSDHSWQSSEDRSLEANSVQSVSTEERTESTTDHSDNAPKQNGTEERPTSSRTTSSDVTNSPLKQRHSGASSANHELYTALYNYRAQKDDEIDLLEGEKYQVVEKCRDGWFRGKSVKTHKSGVFPGNYVKLSSHADSSTTDQQPSTSSGVPSCRRSTPSPASVQPPSVVRQKSDISEFSHFNIVAPNERIAPRSQPPPPPAFRNSMGGSTSSTSFLRKFSIGKRKDRSKPLMPPPPAYRRRPPASHRQEGANISLFGPSPHTPPPPYNSRSTAGQLSRSQSSRPSKLPSSLNRERCRVVVAYPPQHSSELELRVGDIVYVFRKHDDGWCKGTLERNGKTGLFPGSFVEKF